MIHVLDSVGSIPLIPEKVERKVVSLLSGGIDSTTLAYLLRYRGYQVLPLVIDYGQRHRREIWAAQELFPEVKIVTLDELQNIWGGSALTDSSIAVPEGHYADPSMAITIVPNRNMTLLSIAAGYAVAQKAYGLALGIHAGDHPIYPDCRPEFIESFAHTVWLAIGRDLAILDPFVHITKTDIVKLGYALKVPYELTWSCYKGGDTHCGVCGTCVERREAFRDAGVEDPTRYEVHP